VGLFSTENVPDPLLEFREALYGSGSLLIVTIGVSRATLINLAGNAAAKLSSIITFVVVDVSMYPSMAISDCHVPEAFKALERRSEDWHQSGENSAQCTSLGCLILGM
jgi:hypothetical protein